MWVVLLSYLLSRFFLWFVIFTPIYDKQSNLYHIILSEATLVTLEKPFSEPLSAHEPRAAREFLLTNPKLQPENIISDMLYFYKTRTQKISRENFPPAKKENSPPFPILSSFPYPCYFGKS